MKTRGKGQGKYVDWRDDGRGKLTTEVLDLRCENQYRVGSMRTFQILRCGYCCSMSSELHAKYSCSFLLLGQVHCSFRRMYDEEQGQDTKTTVVAPSTNRT